MVRRHTSLLFSDQPIKSAWQDSLGTSEFVERLIRPILDWPPNESLVIGLYAPWGTGKTSALNLLEDALQKTPHSKRCTVVRFNPWLYHDETALLESFFKTFREATQTTPLLTPERKQSLNTAIKGISKFVVPVAATMVKPFTQGQDFVTPAAEGILVATDAALSEGEPNFEVQKKKAIEVLNHLGSARKAGRLVMLIDDLDRAESAEVKAMLKLVRLIADLPNVTYVIAMDHKRVQQALTTSSGDQHTNSYLEKIVQIPLQLPVVSVGKVKQLTLEGINDIFAAAGNIRAPTESLLDERRIDIDTLLLWRIRNLRDRARLLNVLRFLLLSGNTSLEVNLVDALLIAFLQLFYPEVVERIRNNKEFFVGSSSISAIARHLLRSQETQRKNRQAALVKLVKLSQQSAANPAIQTGSVDDDFLFFDELSPSAIESRLHNIVLRLFPNAELDNSLNEDADRQYRRENRICSRERFDRYFTFSPPVDEISDAYVTEWLETAAKALRERPTSNSFSDQDVRDFLQDFETFPREKQKSFVAKCVDRLETIPLDVLAKMGCLMALAPSLGLLADDDAARFLRGILAYSVNLQGISQFAELGEDTTTAQRQVNDIQEAAHTAFATLLARNNDALDAVAAAGEHVNLWARRERERRAIKGGESGSATPPLSQALDGVVSVGLSQINAFTNADRDIFSEAGDTRPGSAIWRWRDLLRHRGEAYAPIRGYLQTLLQRRPERLPDVLGLFAPWSDTGPSFRHESYKEIRESAEEILGWNSLLRAFIQYQRLGKSSEGRYKSLVSQFEHKVRSIRLKSS